MLDRKVHRLPTLLVLPLIRLDRRCLIHPIATASKIMNRRGMTTDRATLVVLLDDASWMLFAFGNSLDGIFRPVVYKIEMDQTKCGTR